MVKFITPINKEKYIFPCVVNIEIFENLINDEIYFTMFIQNVEDYTKSAYILLDSTL